MPLSTLRSHEQDRRKLGDRLIEDDEFRLCINKRSRMRKLPCRRVTTRGAQLFTSSTTTILDLYRGQRAYPRPVTDLSQHLDLALTPHAGVACNSTSAPSRGFVWFTRHQSRKMPAIRSPRCTQRPLNAFDKIYYFKRLTKQARCTGRGCSALQVFFCVCSNQHNWNR